MKEKGMSRALLSALTKVLVPLVVASIIGVAFLSAQTASKQKKSTRKTTTQTHTPTQQNKAPDTVTHTRKDTLQGSGETKSPSDTVASSTPPPPSPFQYRKIQNDAFGVGERLAFSVNYGFINAGDAVMSIPRYDTVLGRRCYRVEFTVNSLQSFAWIYKVEDHYLTFIDAEAIAPLKFEQHIREGTYRRDFVAEFDQARHVAKTTEGTYHIPDYVHDIMSAFYFVRTIDFSGFVPGETTTLYNFYKDTSYTLLVRFLGRQELEVEAGTFKTIVVEPLVKEGGLFKSEGRIVIWLSDDERKIPVRVNTKVVIGSIDVELTSYSGLIGPLRAKTD
jgi:hypothetical protein